jgi:hypothetical protein
MKVRIPNLLLIAGGLLLAGCTFNGGYNPSYVSAQPMALGIAGKSLVVLETGDANWTYSGKPTSFTGSATKLTLPLGEITRQVALKVFGAAFRDGADSRNTAVDIAGYRLVVKPKIARFSYAYNQLKNFGFAVTPQVELDLHVALVSPDGKTLLDKNYASGLSEGDTYVLSGQPAEKVNQILHQTLFRLMTDAALDAKKVLEQ